MHRRPVADVWQRGIVIANSDEVKTGKRRSSGPTKFEATCHMRFDQKRHVFFCVTGRGRWTRMGEPLASPDDDLMPNDSLDLLDVKTGRDGQVLVDGSSTVLGGPQFKQYERRYWPDG